MTTSTVDDKLELLRLKELFMSDIKIRSKMAILLSDECAAEVPPYQEFCELTHCTPEIAAMFTHISLYDVILTPEEIAAERDKLEQQKKDEVRCARFRALLIFVQHTDEMVDIIRFSNGPEEICRLLLMQYGLSEYQARYILDIEIGQIRYLQQEEIERKYRYYYEKVKSYLQ